MVPLRKPAKDRAVADEATVAEVLVALRFMTNELGLRQKDVAAITGIAASSLSQYMNRAIKPAKKTAIKILKHYKDIRDGTRDGADAVYPGVHPDAVLRVLDSQGLQPHKQPGRRPRNKRVRDGESVLRPVQGQRHDSDGVLEEAPRKKGGAKVRGICGGEELERLNRFREDNGLRPLVEKDRDCMCCGHSFRSLGNRLCGTCRALEVPTMQGREIL